MLSYVNAWYPASDVPKYVENDCTHTHTTSVMFYYNKIIYAISHGDIELLGIIIRENEIRDVSTL